MNDFDWDWVECLTESDQGHSYYSVQPYTLFFSLDHLGKMRLVATSDKAYRCIFSLENSIGFNSKLTDWYMLMIMNSVYTPSTTMMTDQEMSFGTVSKPKSIDTVAV